MKNYSHSLDACNYIFRSLRRSYEIKGVLPPVWLPFIQEDIPVILDLSDLAKPFARKMDYLATVRDGSTGALVNGYWLVELYVSPGRPESLTLVVSRMAGQDKPMMLLTNLRVEDSKDAKRIVRFYIRRWECEEAIRFLKSQVHLEKIRTFRWSAIRRLVLLAVLGMIYLGRLAETDAHLCERLVSLSQPLPDKPDFLSYRLLGGPNGGDRHLFLATQGVAPERLIVKALSLSNIILDKKPGNRI